MGQLEKYGLYVLCLVIFLILGVTIWGDAGTPPVRRPSPTSGLNATATAVLDAVRPPADDSAVPNLQSLLQPAPRPTPPSRDAAPVDASGTLNAGAGSGVAPLAKEPEAAAPNVDPGVGTAAAPRPTYKVARGDTFDSIAKQQLGRASLRTEIARLNPSVRPERLQVGQVLVLPAASEVGGAVDAPTPAKSIAAAEAVVSYTIGKGDTYEAIARRQLGDRKRVAELKDLNPGIDPTRLRVGQKIRLPKK